jgi:hypothetical protein
MEGAEDYVDERLDQLGLVAGVCHEIGLATWLDTQEPGNRQQVSVGTATMAMVLNESGSLSQGLLDRGHQYPGAHRRLRSRLDRYLQRARRR